MFFGDFMFQFGNVFIFIIFVIVISAILFTAFKGISEWSRNNQSPVASVNSKIVAKRTAVRGGGETQARSTYYVTFETDSGERFELQVKDRDFGMLVEGDRGILSHQGTRYLNFERQNL